MKKIQIFIEHDIIIRHFIFSGAFKVLEEEYDIQYVFPLSPKRVKVDIHALSLQNYKIIDIDNYRAASLKTLGKIVSLWKAKKNKKKYQYLINLYEGLLKPDFFRKLNFLSTKFIFNLYRWYLLKKVGSSEVIIKTIVDFKPNLIIHPCVLEGQFIADLNMLSKKMNIPLIVLMNSWDNPSTKAGVVGLPTALGVWGGQSFQQAVDFIGMPEKRVAVLGAAQFDLYKHDTQFSKKDFLKSLGVLDCNKKIVLYAGSSKSVNEIRHLEILENKIEQGNIQDVIVIFRPHPWRAKAKDEKNFHDIAWRHIYMDPSMSTVYDNGKMNLTSYEDTHNLLSITDLLIANMSTIMLEAFIHHVPVLCMAMDSDFANNAFFKTMMDTTFMQEFIERMEIKRIATDGQIDDLINGALALKGKISFDKLIKRNLGYFVDMTGASYSVKLQKLVESLIEGKND